MKIRLSSTRLAALALFLLIGLTSCGDIEQSLKINPDGSGTLETSVDVGEMMSMMKGMGDMGNMINEDVTISEDRELTIEIDSTTLEPEAPADPMQAIFDKVTDTNYGRDFDTLIAYTSIMPDSVKAKETRMDLVSKINMRIKSPANSSSLSVGVVMNFDNQEQLQEIVNYLETMDQSSTASVLGGGPPLESETFLVFEADLKAGWIRFDTMDYTSFAPEVGISADSMMDSESLAMMEMMFGNSKIKSTTYVPGEVTSCSNKDAILTKDNRVIVEHGLMDAIKKGKIPGYTIYFTPKK